MRGTNEGAAVRRVDRQLKRGRRRAVALVLAAGQADAYLRHAIDTGNPVNVNAIPLLNLRQAVAQMKAVLQ